MIKRNGSMSAKQVAKLKVSTKKKLLKCTTCDNDVSVDESVFAVKCWLCTSKMAPVPKKLVEAPQKSDKPAGWRFMAEFVDKDGNVFFFGEEQPKLKGTREPSDVDKIRQEQKKKRKETKKKKELRDSLKESRLIKQHEKKKRALKKAETKKQKKLEELKG